LEKFTANPLPEKSSALTAGKWGGGEGKKKKKKKERQEEGKKIKV